MSGEGGDVLLLSMRRLERLVGYTLMYEFEDLITQLAFADRVEVGGQPALDWSRRVYKLARYMTGSPRLARFAAPHPSPVRLERDYELFFPTFSHAYQLFALASIPNWRKRCRVAACYICELWVKELPVYLLELLKDFDHVFLGMRDPMEAVARITARPCTYLPLAADVLGFSPFPDPVPRSIDVCYVGRRSATTHAALLELARERRLNYYFDTVAASGVDQKQRTFRVEDAAEHRLLLSSLLRRSRFYVANRARVNEPVFTRGREEISGRFFEGAAAGTVMLGEPPDSETFRGLFDWPESVIRMPFDAVDVGARLTELGRDPDRLDRVGRRNAHHAALRHDWVHRLGTVFDTLELARTQAMLSRERELQALALQAMPLQATDARGRAAADGDSVLRREQGVAHHIRDGE